MNEQEKEKISNIKGFVNDSHASSPLRIEYCLLSEDFICEVSNLFINIFMNDEPTTKARDADPEKFLSLATLYANYLCKKKLSFIALDRNTQLIIGFIFCVDLGETFNSAEEWMTLLDQDFPEEMKLIDELERQYIDIDKVPAGTVLHIFHIGIDRDFRRKDIAQTLILQALNNARDMALKKAIAECTSQSSYQLFKKCGFIEVGYIDYDQFSFEGNPFFSKIEGGIYLMSTDL